MRILQRVALKSINCKLSSDVLPPKKTFALQLSSIANFQITRTRKHRKAMFKTPRVLSFFYFIKIINYVHMHDKVNIKNRQIYTIKIVEVTNAFMKRYHENISNLLFQKISFFPKCVSFFFLFFFFFLTEDSEAYISQIYGSTRVVWLGCRSSIKGIPPPRI